MPGKVDHGAHLLATERIAALSPAAKACIRDHLDELIKSPELGGTRRCQHLLQFVVTEALNGNFQNLRERVIGEKVFGRLSSYDTGADAVVRVSANELRKRLAQCYLNAGGATKVQIGIPSGSYIPEFRFGAEPVEELTVATEVVEPLRIISHETPATPTNTILIYALSVLLILSIAAGLGMWLKLRQIIPETPVARFLPWTAVLNGTSRTFIVLGDTGAAAAQDILRSSLSLDDYIRHNYIPQSLHPDARTAGLAHYLTSKRFTSLADAEIATRVGQINPFPLRRPILRFAREMQVDDFKNSNAILLDSRRTNPWVELFQSRLNFHLIFDESLRRHIVQNQSPKPGEKSLYIPAGTTGTPGEAYAVLALLPNLNSSGYVLIIEGTNMEGTEAAGEFAAEPLEVTKALKAIGVTSDVPIRPFELFLKVDATGGTSSHAEVLAYRLPSS